MFNKNNLVLAGLAGASAAAVTLLGLGGYLLHKKVLKYRLHEQVKQQALSLAFFELANGNISMPQGFDDFDYGHEDYSDSDYGGYEDDYLDSLLDEVNQEGNGQ